MAKIVRLIISFHDDQTPHLPSQPTAAKNDDNGVALLGKTILSSIMAARDSPLYSFPSFVNHLDDWQAFNPWLDGVSGEKAFDCAAGFCVKSGTAFFIMPTRPADNGATVVGKLLHNAGRAGYSPDTELFEVFLPISLVSQVDRTAIESVDDSLVSGMEEKSRQCNCVNVDGTKSKNLHSCLLQKKPWNALLTGWVYGMFSCVGTSLTSNLEMEEALQRDRILTHFFVEEMFTQTYQISFVQVNAFTVGCGRVLHQSKKQSSVA